MRFVLSLIVIAGATIGISMNVSHDFLVPYEENIVWMKEGKLESTSSGGAHVVARLVIPPDAFAHSFAPPGTEARPPEQRLGMPPGIRFEAELRHSEMSASGDSATGVIAPPRRVQVPREPLKPILFHLPVVIDAGRLRSAGTVITLDGIVALDRNRTCRGGDGQVWRCGQQAAAALSSFIRRRSLECDRPSGARTTFIAPGIYPANYRARCRVNDVDLSRWLVQNGWAEPVDPRFAAEARAARMARVGQWDPASKD